MASANVAATLVVPSATKISPYWDDHDEDKNFMRILFRPGYAVQSRELTQIQTILQGQIERFGRHVFDNGSPVIGGDVAIPQNGFDTLITENEHESFAITASEFRNKTLVRRGSFNVTDGTYSDDETVVFRVVTTSESNVTDKPSFYGSYLSSERFVDGDVIKVQGEQKFATLISLDHASISSVATLRDSIFFYNGFFVKVPAQACVIGKYTLNPFCRVGLEFDDEIVTESQDTSLLDPAQEASNYQAPGAARYKMDLTLTTRSLDSIDDSKFIELARIENGVIKKQIKFPVYSELEEVFARRTYDESGNYTVRPFNVTMMRDPYDDVNYINARLGAGKAYIVGYEFETPDTTDVRVPKARSKVEVVDYDFNLNYGNYIYVNNLNGLIDPTNDTMVDIHCVSSDGISTVSNTAYESTKIGTTKVSYLNYYGADNPNLVNTRQYEMYLFDTKMQNITGLVATNCLTNTFQVTVPTKLSAVDEAYTGATMKVANSNYKFAITAYDGTNKTFTVEPAFFETANGHSISIDFDFGEAESFYISTDYTPGTPLIESYADVSILSKANNDPTDVTYILEPSLGTLLFPFPEKYVAANLTQSSYVFTRRFDRSFSGGNMTASMSANGNETFEGSASSSNISSDILDNFLVICTDPLSSGRAAGEVVKVTATEETDGIKLHTGAGGSDTFDASIFAKMTLQNGAPKKKVFVQANVTHRSSSTADFITGWNTGSKANVFLDVGQVIISNPTRRASVPETLYISDVVGISKIYDLDGSSIPAADADLTALSDVTDRYEFNNGQKDTHYDHAYISLKPGYASVKGPLIVCCYYFEHQRENFGANYFSVDSYFQPNPYTTNVFATPTGGYLGDGYSVIPYYTKTDGTKVNLRDCIDFRPARMNASGETPNYEFTDTGAPSPATDMWITYSYYLGRRDLITLNGSRQFQRIEGIPSKFPQDPAVPDRSMVLYSLGIPPYTMYPTDVVVKYVDNKRYTMRDIGKIDKRLENVEYYVALNTLEKKAVDMAITDVNGLNRTKYGIFVDSFTGHAMGASDKVDYQCGMNFGEGYLSCMQAQLEFDVTANTSLSSDIVMTRDKILMNYEETPFVTQGEATKYVSVNDFVFGVFEGTIVTLPESDIWKATTLVPTIIKRPEPAKVIVVEKIVERIVQVPVIVPVYWYRWYWYYPWTWWLGCYPPDAWWWYYANLGYYPFYTYK
jgi:hypothetical protein